jgi:hypothetical protein
LLSQLDNFCAIRHCDVGHADREWNDDLTGWLILLGESGTGDDQRRRP